jgi:hypothetical protein
MFLTQSLLSTGKWNGEIRSDPAGVEARWQNDQTSLSKCWGLSIMNWNFNHKQFVEKKKKKTEEWVIGKTFTAQKTKRPNKGQMKQVLEKMTVKSSKKLSFDPAKKNRTMLAYGGLGISMHFTPKYK